MTFTQNDGHSGLSNEKREEKTIGNFQTALSYLTINDRTAYSVIHVYSNTFDGSPFLQRSDIQYNNRPNFLERLGFKKCENCNILSGKKCYFAIIEEIDRTGFNHSEGALKIQAVYERYSHFADNIQSLFNKMLETDRILYDCGFELPWSNLKLTPIISSTDEKAYAPGFQYDFYQDIRGITKTANQEIMIIEPYPNDEIIDLYLEKIDNKVDIKILIGISKALSGNTKQQHDNFLKVAEKFSKRPGINFELRENADVHDRLFFIDKTCWVSGQSMKDAATKKPTYLLKVESPELFRQVFTSLWQNGKKIV